MQVSLIYRTFTDTPLPTATSLSSSQIRFKVSQLLPCSKSAADPKRLDYTAYCQAMHSSEACSL